MEKTVLSIRPASKGKRNFLLALLAASSLVAPHKSFAQVKAANSATGVYTSANGTPVVDIAKANAAGLSHNQFIDYNVDSKGLVLNNGDSTQFQRQSQLAGAVGANLNLASPAAVILNEVVSTNRSSLAGYTEVVGNQADVIVANPNGITCQGCGFINTSHVSLTTGSPVINAGGALTGFHVDNGDILITGAGLDASAQDYLGLIARSVSIQGQINAKQLDVIAGPNDVDYTSKAVTAHAATGTAPTLAIDSSAMGGMYADRIRLVATEAGVGVRALGDAAAGVGDFTLDGAGKIEVGGHISAANDVKITTTDTSATDAIKTTNAHLTAAHNLALTAAGNVHLTGGALYAYNNLTIDSGTLSDESTGDTPADNNTRYAAGNLTLTDNGLIFLGGTSWGTAVHSGSGPAHTFTITGGELAIDNGGETLYGDELDVTTAGEISLNTATVSLHNDINLTSTADLFVNNTGAEIKSDLGHIDITSVGSFTNAGAMSADAGDVTIHAGNTIQNTGTMHAGGAISLADNAGNGGEIVQNYGTLLADDTLNLNAATLDNYSAGNIQGTHGSTFTLGALNNDGILIASATAADAGTINADALTNSATGTIQSAGDLNLNIKDTATNSNKILATGTGNLSLLARSGTLLSVTNNSTGILQAGGILAIGGNAGGHNASIITQAGKLLGDASLNFNLTALTNGAAIQGGTGASTITVANTLTNNNGGVINLATNVSGSGTVNAATITNTGTLQSAGALNLGIGTLLTNNVTTGQIISAGSLTIAGLTGSAYTIHNHDLIQSTGGVLSIKGHSAGTGVDIYADSGSRFLGNSADINTEYFEIGSNASLTAAQTITLSATQLVSDGSTSHIIGGSGASTITVGDDFTNNGAVYVSGDLTFSAPNIYNESTAAIAAGGTAHIHATGGDLENYGALYAGTLLDLNASNDVFNHDAGTIDGDSNITITAGQHFFNNNNINALGNLTISALYFYNEVTGGDTRSGFTDGTTTQTDTGWGTDPDDLIWDESTHKYYTKTWTATQSYGTTPTHKPELLANGTLTIQNFQTGLNLGGIISANTVDISTSHGGATFTNDDYSLLTRHYTETWDDYVSCCSDVIYLDYTYGENDTTSYTTTSVSYGGGIYAHTLNASGFALSNVSSPYASASSNPTSASGASGGTLAGNASNAAGANTVTLGGLPIPLPSNPNGPFVPSKDPGSKYLIETNPQYGVGSSFLGSDYMATHFGLDPDTLEKRLGDANYEASLIRDQVVNEGAAALLNGTDEASAMQKLMDNGVSEGKSLGLSYGVAPTAAQIASLTGDMVWMVDTVVGGQHVLAPVVYLSPETKSQIASGAVISATNANMQLASLTNTGGTITGSQNLNITSTGNITNTSGQIGGGNVSLTSTSGDIVNQTFADTSGGAGNQHTDIGKTAGITATGNLNVNAAHDVDNTGANMSAGGDASLAAGNNINFTTVQDKESSSSHSGGNSALGGGDQTDTTNSSTTNHNSGLTAGGNLTTNSGNDTTFNGTNANVGGNASINAGGNLAITAANDSTDSSTSHKSGTVFSGDSSSSSDHETTNDASTFNIGGNLDSTSKGDTTIQGSNINVAGNGAVTAGGNLNILDGQNTSDTSSSHTHSGLGTAGGVYGVEGSQDTDQKGTSVASNLNFGGNGALKAGNDITVQGSNVAAKGNLGVDAGNNVNVLEGRNTDVSTHTDTSVAFGKVDGSSSSLDNKAGAGATAGSDGSNNSANADANASASSDRNGSGGVTLAEGTSTTTTHSQSHAAGSTLSSGGDMTVNAGNDVTLRGSNVNAGGDAAVNAKNVNVLAATDTDTTTTSTTDQKIGLYGDSANHAGAGADANANASADGTGNPNASAGADANASATTDNTLDVSRTDQSTDTTTDITHTGSGIHSGGNTTVNAQNQLNVNGSTLDSGGDMTLNAKDMSFTAAQDSHTETKTDSLTKAGLYASGDASADANAGANAEGISAGASAGANADANAGVGLYGTNTTTGSTDGTTTAQTSTIHSGGNMTRNASGDITDEGTQIDAGGNFNQTATTWTSKAAQNTTFSSSNSETNTAKLGLYGEANAGASGSASTTGGTDSDNGADASAGIAASYNRSTDGETANSSNAVVSNIHAGGSVNSTTTGKTALEGTNMDSGGDTNLNAGSLDYKAAQNTASSSSNTTSADAGLKVGVDASKDVNVDANADYGQENKSASSTTAVTGSMTSGGNLHINTGGDANFEGTNIAAKGDTGIAAGGNVNYSAAHNTSTSSDTSLDAGGSISLSKGKSASGKGSNSAGLDASADYGTSQSSENDAVTGSVKSGGNLSVTSGKNATFEGTQLASGGDTSVGAAGDVSFKAAQSTSSASGYNVGGSLSLSKGGTEKGDDGKEQQKGSSGAVSLNGGYNNSNATTSQVASINSGGKVNVASGNDVNLEGTNIASTGNTSLNAAHDVNFTAATNTSSSVNFSGGIDGSAKKPDTPETPPATTAGDKKEGTEKEGNVSLDLSGGQSTTKTGGSINAGSININSGHDTNLEGTKTASAGDTNINAGNNVNLTAAKSTDVEGGIGGSVGSGGAGLTRASIGGGETNTGVSMTTGGDMNLASGGKTTMQGTTVDANGNANIDAQGGLDKQTTVSGGANLGLDHAGADLDVQGTTINAKGNKAAPAMTPQAIQQQMTAVGNDKNMSDTEKSAMTTILSAVGGAATPAHAQLAQQATTLQQQIDKVESDPSLSSADKAAQLHTLDGQLQALVATAQSAGGAPAAP